MEKIKITKEQEEAYKLLLVNSNYDAYRVLSDFNTIRDKQLVYSQYKPLLSLTIEELSHILNRWYEVVQPFEVGDWVLDKDLQKYRQIDCGDWTTNKTVPLKTVVNTSTSFEKVTEPWKIMLLELGRGKPEFKVGDKYTTNEDNQLTIHYIYEDEESFDSENFKNGQVKYFYPVESRIELNKYNK